MSVWKVLIADDEPKIRRGLRGELEALGEMFEVVAEAEDGEIALEMAEKLRPDILLVDIQMPILNGLQLVEKLRAVSTDWLIIIITGHDEFDYARQALQMQVFDYLLKPLNRETFTQALDAARNELSARRQTDLYLGWSQKQLAANLPLLRESFLRHLIAGSLSQSELDENFDFLQLRIPEACTILGFHLVERVLGSGSGRESYRKLLLLTLKSLVASTVESLLGLDQGAGGLGVWRHEHRQSSLPLIFEDENETILVLLPVQKAQQINAIQAEVEQRSVEAIHHNPSFAIAQMSRGIAELPELYESLSNELLDRGHSEPFIQLIQNYLEANYHKPNLTLEEVAQEMLLSPSYLSRILKQKTGASFIDCITRLRVKKATQFMADPSIKVFEIAEKVGYHSQHYFSRAFKKVLGISPSEYRKGGTE